jgi:hypothetical protein
MPLWARLFGFCSRDPAADLWFRALALGAHGAEHGHVGELAILAERASSSQVLRAQRSWGRTPGALGVGVAVGSAALDLRWLAMGDGENRVRTLHSLPPDFFRQGPIAIRRSSAAGLGLGLLLTFAARGARKGGAATDVLAGCPPRFLWGETCRVARGIFARGFREHDALRGGGRIFCHHPAHVAARGPWRAKNKRSNGAKRPQLLRGSDDGREAP